MNITTMTPTFFLQLPLLMSAISTTSSLDYVWSPCNSGKEKILKTSCSSIGLNNTCYQETAIFKEFEISEEKIGVCARELTCPYQKYLADDCTCSKTMSECYHGSGLKYTPYFVNLPSGNCTHEILKALQPKYCSINIQNPDCDPTPHRLRMDFIYTKRSYKYYVTEKRIEVVQAPINGLNYITPDHFPIASTFNGDKYYCDIMGAPGDCYTPVSGNKPYRVFARSAEYRVYRTSNCWVPIYSQGNEVVTVYYNKSLLHQDGSHQTCKTCKVDCLIDKVDLIVNFPGWKDVRVCSDYTCKITTTLDKSVYFPRDFHSKVLEREVTIEVISRSDLMKWKTSTTCPLTPICEAIDCYFCMIKLLNYFCYKWYDILLLVILLYFILIGVGLTVWVLKPFFRTCLCFFKLTKKCGKKLVLKTAKRSKIIKNRLSRVIETNLDNDSDEEPLELSQSNNGDVSLLKIIKSNKPRNVKGLYPHYGFVVLCVISLIPTSKTLLISPQWALNNCANSVTMSVSGESCERVNNRYECDVKFETRLEIASLKQKNCLFILSDSDTILSTIEVTTLDILLHCNTEIAYHTKDFEMKTDSLFYCPHSGLCSEQWCSDLNSDDHLIEFSKVDFPKHVMCKMGPACWGNGCFYCTESCRVIRYYAQPKTDKDYKIYRCPSWTPSIILNITVKSLNKIDSKILTLNHGEHNIFSNGLNLISSITIEEQIPLLSKYFITDGFEWAITDASHPGQPITGTLGQIQCESSNINSDCDMAPNICQCSPQAGTQGCDCTNIDINKIFSPQNKLPLHHENLYLIPDNDFIKMRVGSYGSAELKIQSNDKLVGVNYELNPCKVEILKITGCYGCITGAVIHYRCMSTSDQNAIVQCSDANFQIKCDTSQSDKTAILMIKLSIFDMKCRTECSKDAIQLSGTLQFVGHPDLSNTTHLSMFVRPKTEDVWTSIKKVFQTLSYKLLIYIISLLIGVLLLVKVFQVITKKILDFTFDSKNVSTVKTQKANSSSKKTKNKII